MHQQTNKQTNW